MFDHTLELMQHLKADSSLIKTLNIFRYDHLQNDHPFFKKKNFSCWKVTFFQKDWVSSQRLHVFFLKETHCRCYCWLLQIILVICKGRNPRIRQKKNPHYFSQGHMNPTCKVNPSCSLFNFLRRRINKRSCANAFDWASLPTSLAGSTLTTTWEKQW